MEDRRYGDPLTNEERMQRHYENYGSTDLPPRGTGIQGFDTAQNWINDNWKILAIGALGILVVLLMRKR